MNPKNIDIYLAGKVDGEKVALSRRVKANLPEKTICWHRSDGGNHSEHEWGCSYWSYFNEDLRDILKETCLDEIDGSEFLLAYLDVDSSYGSIAEIAYASCKNKNCYLIILDPDAANSDYDFSTSNMHDAYWFISHFPNVRAFPVATFEDAVNYATRICKLESPIEHKLYQAFKKSLEIEPQYSIGNYRVDFACLKTKTAIEVDGHAWHSTKDQRGRDAQRDRFLQSEGWRVLRFTGSEIYANPIKCADEITNHISQSLNKQVTA